MFTDYDGLALFVKVAEAGGFAAAERATGVPKATLSRRIGRLEGMLRQRLLRRSRKGVVLTEAGLRLLEEAQRGFAMAERAIGGLGGEAAALSGTCRMSLPPDLARLVLAPVLIAFRKENPGVTLDIHLADRRVSLVEEGIDLVVRAGPFEDSFLRFRRLAPIPRRLVASPAFLGAHPPIKAPADLAVLPGLGIRRDLVEWRLERAGTPTHPVRPEVAFVANSQSVLRDAAVAGIGIASLLDFLIEEDLAAGRLAAVLPQWSLAPITMTALWRRDRITEPLVKALVGKFQQALMPHP